MLPAGDPRGDRRARASWTPERGVRPRRRRRPRGGRRPSAPLRADPKPSGLAVSLRDRPDDLLRLTIETDDADEVFWAIVHSHTRRRRGRHRRTSGSPSTRTRCTSSSRSPGRDGRRYRRVGRPCVASSTARCSRSPSSPGIDGRPATDPPGSRRVGRAVAVAAGASRCGRFHERPAPSSERAGARSAHGAAKDQSGQAPVAPCSDGHERSRPSPCKLDDLVSGVSLQKVRGGDEAGRSELACAASRKRTRLLARRLDVLRVGEHRPRRPGRPRCRRTARERSLQRTQQPPGGRERPATSGGHVRRWRHRASHPRRTRSSRPPRRERQGPDRAPDRRPPPRRTRGPSRQSRRARGCRGRRGQRSRREPHRRSPSQAARAG